MTDCPADGRSMFRQHDRFNTRAFVRFPRAAVRKFGKICLIVDNAPKCRAKMIRHLVDKADGLTLKLLQVVAPEISACEICWRDLRRRVPDVSYANLNMLRKAISRYTRCTKPNLGVEKILYRVV